MWKRILFDNSTAVITMVAFACTATAYVLILVRALATSKEDRDKLAAMPLEDERTERR